MNIFYCILIAVVAMAASSCVSKSKANADARAAYVAGQKEAYESMGAQMTGIVVLGDVDKHEIPWVTGLTLTQALATANYKGMHDPAAIILKRNSVQTQIDPKKLLTGEDVRLQPGDVISVVGQ